ncbi:MAG TPA: hypothetical protein VK217_08415, partial [Acidimicrobiales bacterium]|nr:hypothetical protein [Acidimicrobiales bacterium]
MAALVGPLGFGVSPIPRVSQAPEPASGGNRTEASGRRRGGVGARSAPWFPRTACEEDLIEAALGEVRRGETWVKLVADFPDIRDPGAPEPTYPVA